MENITVSGMKEINQKLGHIERNLEDISKSLALIAKVLNKQVPKSTVPSQSSYVDEEMAYEDDDDD